MAAPVIRRHIERGHYSRTMPSGIVRCYAVFHGTRIVGAAVFTLGMNHCHTWLAGASRQQVRVLSRLWLEDRLPKNSESRVLAVIMRDLSRTTDWKAVVTYADPTYGHSGAIYRAAGFLYLGQNDKTHLLVIRDRTGKIQRISHDRSIKARYGSETDGVLALHGLTRSKLYRTGKHRYVKLLDPSWRARVIPALQPYPKDEVAV